uniref:Cyclic nucleotide-binding domain-containing protein n=1 Tax=Odontella aurita TaxID=265563 RepID=A0A7S4HXZ6_9STRA|mmetsp:Transcript_16933/g.48928  ORF Transcript_16933/g.48928 Transcript_16933/m.48928 type:complete len:242 (+) Transcript_16933:309-1034(+)
MTAGETLGEAVLEDGGFRRATCVTEEPTELLVLKKEHFDMTFKKFLEREHEEKVDFLSGIGCFTGWDRKKLSKAAKYCRQRTYREGEVIVSQDAPADNMFFIKSGLVSMLRTLTVDVGSGEDVHNEQEQEEHSIDCEVCVAKICAGDIIGEATILDPEGLGVFPSSAVCETQAVCYRLDRVQIKNTEWDDRTRAELKSIAVVYPEASILLQAHIDHLQFKKRSSQIMKIFWGKQKPKKRLR